MLWLTLVTDAGRGCEGCQWSLVVGLATGGLLGLMLGLVVRR